MGGAGERAGGRVAGEEGADDGGAAHGDEFLVGVQLVSEAPGEDLAEGDGDDVSDDACA